jgi:hypothetical protein
MENKFWQFVASKTSQPPRLENYSITMIETITDITRLGQILKQHTGSAVVPYELSCNLRYPSYGKNIFRYNRGKSSLFFRCDSSAAGAWLDLLEVRPKVKFSMFRDGLDQAKLDLLQPEFNIGAKLYCGYRPYSVRLQTPRLMPEFEIIEYLGLFFLEAYYTDTFTNLIAR